MQSLLVRAWWQHGKNTPSSVAMVDAAMVVLGSLKEYTEEFARITRKNTVVKRGASQFESGAWAETTAVLTGRVVNAR